MRSFSYTAYTQAGKRTKGVIVGEDEKHVAQSLRAQGMFAETITARQERAQVHNRRWALRKRRMSLEVIEAFTRQMAVLLESDLPIDTALDAIGSARGAGQMEGLVSDLKSKLLDGYALSVALRDSTAAFPAYYIAAVSAGENSGKLAAVFETLANHLENLGNDRASLATALIYPAFVATVSVIVCGVLMVNVTPEIVSMFEVSGRELPPLTEFMIGLTDFIIAWWSVGLLVLAGLVVGFAAALRVPRFRAAWHRVTLSLPVIGNLIRLSAAAQYLRTLALVISSRQPVLDASRSASDVLEINHYREQAMAATEAIRRGESLSRALDRLTLIPPVTRQLISVGEDSARLAQMTERSAVLVETWLQNDRKRMTALLDPILMLVIGSMVLVIVLSVLLPIFDLQSMIGTP